MDDSEGQGTSHQLLGCGQGLSGHVLLLAGGSLGGMLPGQAPSRWPWDSSPGHQLPARTPGLSRSYKASVSTAGEAPSQPEAAPARQMGEATLSQGLLFPQCPTDASFLSKPSLAPPASLSCQAIGFTFTISLWHLNIVKTPNSKRVQEITLIL